VLHVRLPSFGAPWSPCSRRCSSSRPKRRCPEVRRYRHGIGDEQRCLGDPAGGLGGHRRLGQVCFSCAQRRRLQRVNRDTRTFSLRQDVAQFRAVSGATRIAPGTLGRSATTGAPLRSREWRQADIHRKRGRAFFCGRRRRVPTWRSSSRFYSTALSGSRK